MVNYLIVVAVILLLVTVLCIYRFRHVANAFNALDDSEDQAVPNLQKNIDKVKALNYFLFGVKSKFLNKNLKQRIIHLNIMSFKKLNVAELSYCLNSGLVILNFFDNDSSKKLVTRIIDNNFEVINMTHNDILHKLNYDFKIVNDSHLKLAAAQNTDQEIMNQWFLTVGSASAHNYELIIRTRPINITGMKFDFCQEKISKLTWNPYGQLAIDSLDIFALGYNYFSTSFANIVLSLSIDDYYKLDKKSFMKYCRIFYTNNHEKFNKIMHMVLMRGINDFSKTPVWFLDLLKDIKSVANCPEQTEYSCMYSCAYILSVTNCNSPFKLEDVLGHASLIIKNKFQVDNCKRLVMYRACQLFSGYIVPFLNNIKTESTRKKFNGFFDILSKHKSSIASDLRLFFEHLDLNHKSYCYCWQIYLKSVLSKNKKPRFLDLFVYKFGLWPMVIKKLPSKFDIKSALNLCFLQIEKYKQADLFAEEHKQFISSFFKFINNPGVLPLDISYLQKNKSLTSNTIIPPVLRCQHIGAANAKNRSK